MGAVQEGSEKTETANKRKDNVSLNFWIFFLTVSKVREHERERERDRELTPTAIIEPISIDSNNRFPIRVVRCMSTGLCFSGIGEVEGEVRGVDGCVGVAGGLREEVEGAECFDVCAAEDQGQDVG